MKKPIIILSILFLTKIGYPQSIIHRNVPLVKENPQVDSLIEYLKIRDRSNPVCFSINIKTEGQKVIFEIHTIDTVNSTIKLNYLNNLFDNPNLSCFKFRTDLIFVRGNIESYNLFERTKFFKSLRFDVTHLRIENSLPKPKDLISQEFYFKGGKFYRKGVLGVFND